jgi:hypothetical protein
MLNTRNLSNVIRSRWVLLLFILPAGIYIAYRLLEYEATRFIIPFFPREQDKSFGFYQDFLRLCFNELLWISLFFFVAWYFFRDTQFFLKVAKLETQFTLKSRLYISVLFMSCFLLTLIVAAHTLQQFPNSADEYAYIHQAETLSEGKLWQKSHPLADFFRFNHIAQKDGKMVGRFPPGWPLVLSTAFVVNIPPFIINPILGLLALILFYRLCALIYNKQIAWWSVCSLAFTGYFIFNSASFFSHTSCLLFALGFVYCIYRDEKKPATKFRMLAGAFLGMLVISRYFTAALIFLPFVFYLIHRDKLKVIRLFFWIGLGVLPFLAFLMWYNYKITGNALLPVTVWTNNEEALGFVHGHTFIKGIDHLIRRTFMFLYWSSPALLILYLLFIVQKVFHRQERFTHPEDYIFLLLIIGYFFYHHIGGNQYGPRFLFEAFPFMIAFVVRKLFQQKLRGTQALFVAGMIYALVKIPFIMNREHEIIIERMDVYRLAKKSKIENAVVMLSTTTGVKRPMPVRDLTRNGQYFSGDIIYAESIPGKNAELMEFYPDRFFYEYKREAEKVEGRLVKIR